MFKMLLHGPERSESERGATAIEYAVMVALIALVIVASVATLGLAVFDLFDSLPNPIAA